MLCTDMTILGYIKINESVSNFGKYTFKEQTYKAYQIQICGTCQSYSLGLLN